ncbi:MAG: alpha-ribazole phosphatase family protein [Rhodobacteraceae bacterium]|nr:alpha-ribazole phosphatase family protein [Paracoccaceae bacterium]
MGMILLRHTRPDAPEGLCYGRLDLPPAACFAAHAAALANDLPPITRIVTSPLQRCKLLAQAIAAARNLPVVTDLRLREMDFGAWEGRLWSDLPRAELDAWAADLLHARPHGGESVAQLRDRALTALRAHAGQKVLVVTHHGVIKCARQLTEGDSAWQSTLNFGGWLRSEPNIFHAA